MRNLLSVALRTILRGVVRCCIRIHGFAAPLEATYCGHRGLSLNRNRGWDAIVVGSISWPLGILWNGETRSRPSVNVLVDVGLLLRWVGVRVVGRQGGSHRRLLRNVGRWNWSDVIDVQVYISRGLLVFLGLIVALLLEGRGDCRKDGLELRLERLSWTAML